MGDPMRPTTLPLLAVLLCVPALARGQGVAPAPAPAPAPPPAAAPAPASGAPELELEAVDFDEAVRRAAQRATAAAIAREEVRRAEGLLAQARSGSLPLVGGTGTYTHLDTTRRESGGRIIAAQNQ